MRMIDKIMNWMDTAGINVSLDGGILNYTFNNSNNQDDHIIEYINSFINDEYFTVTEFVEYRKAHLRDKKLSQLDI